MASLPAQQIFKVLFAAFPFHVLGKQQNPDYALPPNSVQLLGFSTLSGFCCLF
jgi:hypothetical protein